MEPRVQVQLCMDVGSIYSWFCLTVLLRYRERWGLRLKLLPVLLGAVHGATGNAMPSRVPARGRWMQEDLKRNTVFMGVPYRGTPASFGSATFNSMLCQRLLTAVAESEGYESEELVAMFIGLFKSIWGVQPNHDVDITDPDFVLESCLSAGLSREAAEAYLELTKDATIKLRLKENTALAVEKGAFGTPTMFVKYKEGCGSKDRVWREEDSHDIMIFGSDRFEQLAFVLGKRWDGPIPPLSKL